MSRPEDPTLLRWRPPRLNSADKQVESTAAESAVSEADTSESASAESDFLPARRQPPLRGIRQGREGRTHRGRGKRPGRFAEASGDTASTAENDATRPLRPSRLLLRRKRRTRRRMTLVEDPA